MLPDTVHKLPREERYAYARLLAFMARVDNELTIDEMAMFEQRLGTALLSPKQREMIRTALKTPPSLEECLSALWLQQMVRSTKMSVLFYNRLSSTSVWLKTRLSAC